MRLSFIAANRRRDSLNATRRGATISQSIMVQRDMANFVSNGPAMSGIPLLRSQVYRFSQVYNSLIGIEFRVGIRQVLIGHSNVIQNFAEVLEFAKYLDDVEVKLVVEAARHSQDLGGTLEVFVFKV